MKKKTARSTARTCSTWTSIKRLRFRNSGAVGDVMGALLREIAAALAAGEAGDDKDHG